MRQNKKFPGMKLDGSPLWIRLVADASRIGHPEILRQAKAMKGKSRARLIRASSIVNGIINKELQVDLDKVKL